MQDSEIRDLLFETAFRLLNEANVATAHLNNLHDCLEWAATKGQGDIIVALMFMIRGSEIKTDGIIALAYQLTPEGGFSSVFVEVCRAIDRL